MARQPLPKLPIPAISMHWTRSTMAFEMVKLQMDLIRDGIAHNPNLYQQSLLNAAQGYVNRRLKPVTPAGTKDTRFQKSVRDSYYIVPLKRTDTTVGVGIGNSHPAFGTFVSGSATRNIDIGGSPYKIFPKVAGGWLKISGKPFGTHLHRPDLSRITHVVSTLSSVSKGGKPRFSFSLGPPLIPVTPGVVGPGSKNPGGMELHPVTGVKFGPVRRGSGGKSRGKVTVLHSGGGHGSRTYGFDAKSGAMFIRYVSHHPGRLPDEKLREELLYGSDDTRDEVIPAAILGSVAEKIGAFATKGGQEVIALDIPHRYAGIDSAGGVQTIIDQTLDFQGFIKVTGATRTKADPPISSYANTGDESDDAGPSRSEL